MTRLAGEDMLKRLGRGDSIAEVAAGAGLSRTEFDAWWKAECVRRVPPMDGTGMAHGLRRAVEIGRDTWGIPRVQASSDLDLFFGFGYATAQDRLFQLDYLRRKARGRLAEVLGESAVESDVFYRTLGVGAIADREWTTLPVETRDLLASYSDGINALIEASGDLLPIEFGLLDYRPEPWSPADSLAIVGEFRWYLTGRFPVIVIPELARRALGDGPLYRAFLRGEADDESIVPRAAYRPGRRAPDRVGTTVSDREEGQGSNNWAIAPDRTVSGAPILASDPHIPFAAVSIWHEIHLEGGTFNVAGVALAGMPAVMIGRNARVAWGITNNICSQRDLYQEQTSPEHAGCFLYDGQWEPASERVETIGVRGEAPVEAIVRSSRNGPIVDPLLPPQAAGTGPVSLRWAGQEPCGWLTALLGMNRANDVGEFRQATRPWRVPTFNLVYADVNGAIGHQTAGEIPIRRVPERGYRPGWDPAHQWTGAIPFEEMPHFLNPPSGLVVAANNRLAPDDFPYPLAGTWSSGHRARRIRRQLESRRALGLEENQRLQHDVRSGRAVDALPHLVALLSSSNEPRILEAVALLNAWNGDISVDSVAATLFNVFLTHWCRAIAAERFDQAIAGFVAGNAGGLAVSLLAEDSVGWFPSDARRTETAQAAFRAALDELSDRLGPAISEWRWGKIHTLVQKHPFSGRGDLGSLLDRSGLPIGGDGVTVSAATQDATHAAYLGAGYRMVTDLADPGQGLWAVEVAGSSGHPGSPHYDDQISFWAQGGYHYIALNHGGNPLAHSYRLERKGRPC